MSRMLYGEDVYEVPNWNEEDPRLGWYPMQFTGLRDKNGKEIWEGDILLYTKSKSRGKDQKRKIELHYWVVSMSVNGQWVATRGEIAQSLASATERHEVIGNIYESPELLTPHN